MKVISISEFTTEEGTGKTTAVNLDARSGVFFQIVTGTFKTPLFTLNNDTVPVNMVHGDREQENVILTVNNKTVEIYQGYRQTSHGYLIKWVNDDWADTSELTPVTIDAYEIYGVSNSITKPSTFTAVFTSVNSNNVIVKYPGTSSASHIGTQWIKTTDDKIYLCPLMFDGTRIETTGDYTNYTEQLSRMITAYIKPEVYD